ncbi:hypothetical protein EON81_15615 [bacterium]|nr:MAG: hypothetical protein EON81_15615 [bacterium]
MRSTRIVLLACLLIVSAAVPLSAQVAFPTVEDKPKPPTVTIPAGGSGILDTQDWTWIYDSASHKGIGLSKRTLVNGEPLKVIFNLR